MAALSLRLALVLTCAPATALAGVRIVDATGRGDHASIGEAVAAAGEGDVLLVRSGNYPGFQVHDKALVIVRDAGALVTIEGTIGIDGLSVGKTLVLAGLVVHGPASALFSGPALALSGDAGHLRIEDCELSGGRGVGGGGNPWNPGAVGVEMQTCFDAAFARCTIRGGDGEGTAPGMGFFDFGGAGGDALHAGFSAAAVYDCTLRAGAGGGGEGAGGDGGIAYDHAQGGGGAFFSHCTLQGGDGGYAHGWGIGGNGGDALFASSSAHHHLLECTLIPGFGGASTGYGPGPNGQDFAGPGSEETFSGNARTLEADFLAKSDGQLTVIVHGQPGDRVYLMQSERTSFQFAPLLHGVRLEPKLAPVDADPRVVLPASGIGGFVLPLGGLPIGSDTGTLFLQAFVLDASGAPVLGSPVFAQLLRCSALAPDCNGNGSFDTCDLLDGSAQDLGHDGIPDSCDPDCNGNGLPDDLDILNGTSIDANGNGVPDTCEGPHTVHVDASAPPFGDGSAAAPFQTISAGIGASASGDTVRIEDGTYVGALNRDMSLGGRNIVIESAHGPAACVVDCQQLGQAFAVHEGESAVTIRGLSIRNGLVGPQSWATWLGGGAVVAFNSGLRLENCRFESCRATQGGGGVFGQGAALEISDCVFLGNGQATTFSPGGGLRVAGGSATVLGCVFEQNVGTAGGGLIVDGTPQLLVERCTFRGNSAVVYGGGAACQSGGLVDDCLVAGNSAPHGAGISGHGGLKIKHCTIQGNSATQDAGGVYCAYDVGAGGTLALHDSIVWGNSAPSGAQIGSVMFSATLEVRSCDVQGGAAGIVLGAGVLDYDSSNITLPPLFVSPAGADGNPGTWADNDLHLSLSSPCIDAANNNLVPVDLLDLDGDGNTTEPVPFDLDGAARFVDVLSVNDTGIGSAPITDMGAFEHGP